MNIHDVLMMDMRGGVSGLDNAASSTSTMKPARKKKVVHAVSDGLAKDLP
jgi:hypothetical protein